MQLTVEYDAEVSKEVATPENIASGLQSMHEDKAGVLILEDNDANSFMQTYMLSDNLQHIEYQVDLTHYFVDNIPLETATRLFLCFVERDQSWKSAASWTVDAEITALIRSAKDTQIKPLEDTETEADAENNFQWAGSSDGWAQENLKDWQQTIDTAKINLDNNYAIYPREWYSFLMPIWNSRSLITSHNWRGQLTSDEQKQFDELVPIANGLAINMEASFWLQQLHALDLRPIASISTMRSMLKEIREVHNFLTNSEVESVHHPKVREELQGLKEKLAWYRAKKKLMRLRLYKHLEKQVKQKNFSLKPKLC